MSLRPPSFSRAFVPALFVLAASYALAQDVRLDVPFVPTPETVVKRMLELGEVKKDDFVIDLGSGDGRTVIAAAKNHGARALGVDIDPRRIKEANENAKKAGVTDRVEFRQQNLFETDISQANVVTMYLLSSVNLQLRPRLLKELRPGSRVVSHAFDMGDWEADVHEKVDGRDVYLWIIPAQVDGRWTLTQGERKIDLNLKQRYQRIEGIATLNGREVALRNARLNGADIMFSVELDGGKPIEFRGKVSGNNMSGEASGAATGAWRASKES